MIPVLLYLIMEALLPATTFTFRTWEGLLFRYNIFSYAPFYPDKKITTYSVGDLCHHTNKAVLKHESWITDKLGYRNDEFIEQPDILFIGDSFVAGSSLSQDETIFNRLKSKLNNRKKVYNLAPCAFSKFIYYLKAGIIKKPKLIIFSGVERNVPVSISSFNEYKIRTLGINVLKIGEMNMYIDKSLKLYSLNWFQARVRGFKGEGIPAADDSSMYFEQGKTQKHNPNDLSITASVIKSYKDFCHKQGIRFIFMPMPDKETVYYELVPFSKQSEYLFRLDSLLRRENIETINTLGIYNNYRKTHQSILYHTDDTHWNVKATDLIATQIAKQLSQWN